MTPQTNPAGDQGLRLHLVGGGVGATNLISGTYQAGVQVSDSPVLSPQFFAGRGGSTLVSVAAVFDAATAVTDIRFKLQGIPRPEFVTLFAAAPWVDILTLDKFGNPGSGANLAEHVYAASAGNALLDTLMTQNAYMFYELQVIAEATGAATKAGDIAYAFVTVGLRH